MVDSLHPPADVLMIMKMNTIVTKLILLKERLDSINCSMLITTISLIQVEGMLRQRQASKKNLIHKLMQRTSLMRANLLMLIRNSTVS